MSQPDRAAIQARIDGKLKPPGALGRLESLAHHLASTVGSPDRIDLRPELLIFAGDHGVARHPISIAPREVTQQMVMNFLAGGAAVNVFARRHGIPVTVVDCGMLQAMESEDVAKSSLGAGTDDLSEGPAMDAATLERGLAGGARQAEEAMDRGANVLLLGEMGIGNTTPSSALLGHLLDRPAEDVVGPGTGVSGDALMLKRSLVQRALERVGSVEARRALAELGGFEIVHLVGAMLGARERRAVCVVDGFISQVAACYAVEIDPAARDHLVIAHRSAEPPSALALERLGLIPLLDLELRLGEGSGAALAWPLLQAAADFYNDMASFESAGVVL
ncbi:MAG: nicotinate-nucleotide--dimethylbenzimidazole phosphoribosyltransferase [Planctomycetota bacterium]